MRDGELGSNTLWAVQDVEAANEKTELENRFLDPFFILLFWM